MLVLPCYGQQKAAKKASAPVVESAEHRHARLALAEAQADVDEKQKITDAKDSRSNQLEWITINCYDRIPGGIAKPGISIQDQCSAICGSCTDKDEQLSREHAALRDAIEARTELIAASDLLDKARTRFRAVDRCTNVYRTTIDKKSSDITERDKEYITACKYVELYPPPTK